jgi:hypothetical protein
MVYLWLLIETTCGESVQANQKTAGSKESMQGKRI